MSDTPDLKIVEKTSAWTDEQRENPDPALGVGSPPLDAHAPPSVQVKAHEAAEAGSPPPWLPAFQNGTRFECNGWLSEVLHVGIVEGRWLVLSEPVAGPSEARVYKSMYKRLVLSGMGKKDAKRMVREKFKADRAAKETPNG